MNNTCVKADCVSEGRVVFQFQTTLIEILIQILSIWIVFFTQLKFVVNKSPLTIIPQVCIGYEMVGIDNEAHSAMLVKSSQIQKAQVEIWNMEN